MSNPFRLLAPNASPEPSVGPRASEPDSFAVALPDGRSIDVRRVRDPRSRRVKLSVDERGARLSLPMRASAAAAERFAELHRDWLAQQIARYSLDTLPSLVRGETDRLPLHGGTLPMTWMDGRYTRLQRIDDAGDAHLLFTVTARAGAPAIRHALHDFYEAQARADIGRWLPRYLPELPRPLRRVRFKVMSSQWGSLAPDGTMSLDLALVLARPSAFEYVLVHELCHLIRADHSRAFWSEVEARFPNWRDEREYFHAEGRRLKANLRALLSAHVE